MKKLTQAQFDRAGAYLKTQSRPLEGALFEHYFEGAAVDNVLTQLAKFQNPDGGFGRAMEPDMRSPSSSALATEMGLRILGELDLPGGHPLVSAALKYLLESIDPQEKTWRVVPLDVNDHPHAPWWHDEEGSLARTFGDYLLIPRAGILACLYTYADWVPRDWLQEITRATVADLLAMDPAHFTGGGDALVYLLRLVETPGLPASVRDQVIHRLRGWAAGVVARDPAQWSQYAAPPVKLAPRPEAATAGVLADCLPVHLDYLIEGQHPEGFWDVTWAWSRYPDIWEIARHEWRGVLTLETLTALKAFGRIAP